MQNWLSKISFKQVILLSVLSFFWVSVVSAHGLVTSQEKQEEQYLIEFEYSKLEPIIAGEYAHFSVYLLDATTRAEQDFDSVTIRIQKASNEMVLAGTIVASAEEKGKATIGGVMPEEGEYTSSVSFIRNGETISSADFTFTVDPVTGRQNNNKYWPALFIILALWWITKIKLKKHAQQ